MLGLLTVAIAVGMEVYKQPITSTTIEELQEINGIGEKLSQDIHLYLKLNKNASIEDLDDIKYIGEITIKKIKKVYR